MCRVSSVLPIYRRPRPWMRRICSWTRDSSQLASRVVTSCAFIFRPNKAFGDRSASCNDEGFASSIFHHHAKHVCLLSISIIDLWHVSELSKLSITDLASQWWVLQKICRPDNFLSDSSLSFFLLMHSVPAYEFLIHCTFSTFELSCWAQSSEFRLLFLAWN